MLGLVVEYQNGQIPIYSYVKVIVLPSSLICPFIQFKFQKVQIFFESCAMPSNFLEKQNIPFYRIMMQ